jgi:hypothetical protein
MTEHPGKRACFDRENDEWIIDKIPDPPKPSVTEQLAKIPGERVGERASLFGEQTIGDIFNGNG